jgi:23S rRNA U2552 (ribose-2'-O)-methylase RlmE/FtsJ
VRRHRTIFTARRGIVDVSKGPGGWLYYMTSSAIRRIVRR